MGTSAPMAHMRQCYRPLAHCANKMWHKFSKSLKQHFANINTNWRNIGRNSSHLTLLWLKHGHRTRSSFSKAELSTRSTFCARGAQLKCWCIGALTQLHYIARDVIPQKRAPWRPFQRKKNVGAGQVLISKPVCMHCLPVSVIVNNNKDLGENNKGCLPLLPATYTPHKITLFL